MSIRAARCGTAADRSAPRPAALEPRTAWSHVAAQARFDASAARSRDSAERLRAAVRASTFSLTAVLIVADTSVLLYDLAQLLRALS